MIPYKFNQLGISNNKSIYPENASVFSFEKMSESDSCYFSFTPVEDCIIDFGDGNQVVYQGTNTDTRVKHTYDNLGSYIIQIIGNHSILDCYDNYYIREAIQLSNTLISCENTFLYCTGLRKINNNFKIPKSVNSCLNMFSDCYQLETIPSTLKIPNNVTNVLGMFYLCSALKNVKLVNNFLHKDINNMQSMFWLSSFDGDITNIWPDEFTYNGTIKISNMFNGCSKMTGIAPADLLWNSGKTFESYGCFAGCTSLDNYDEIPADWK